MTFIPRPSLLFDGFSSGATINLDPVADAWFARMTSPSTDEQTALNSYILAERAAGHLALKDYALCLCLGAVNSLIEMFSRTAVVNGGVTFPNINGVLFNATDSYLDTGFNSFTDSTNYAQTDAITSGFVYENSDISTSIIWGALEGVKVNELGTLNATQILEAVNSQNVSKTHTIASTSLYALSRVDNLNHHVFKDGVDILTAVTASNGIPNLNEHIGGRNTNGAPGTYWGGTLSTYEKGAGIGINHAVYNTNQRQLLIDLGLTI